VEERRNTKRERVGGGIALLSLILLATGAAAITAHGWQRDLGVRVIAVRGNEIVPATDVAKLAAILKDQKLFAVDIAAAQKRVLANPFIASASVTRDIPDRINIFVTERAPIAALVLGNMLSLDADGYVLPYVRSEATFDLPVLTGDLPAQECVPGKQLTDPNVRESLGLLSTAKLMDDELYRRISEVHIGPGDAIVLYMADFGVPVDFGHGDAAEKLAKLNGFWNEFVSRRGANELREVDLRYADQVIARWHQAKQVVAQ